MPDAKMPIDALALIEAIAGAIRDELGEEVDAYPGARDPEGADPLNRAFRAAARAILSAFGVAADDLPASVSRALLLAASRRLEAEGRDEAEARALIEAEPGSPDDWLCFLALSSRPQVDALLGPDDG